MNKNYKDFDYQTVVVKKDKAEDVTNRYKNFGWNVCEKKHGHYENLIEISFKRKHKITNKDDLQFLQVNYEHYLNREGRLARHKHTKSLIFGLSTFILIALLVTFAIVVVAPTSILLCAICSMVALILLISSMVFTVKIYKKEILVYEREIKICKQEIEKVCAKANYLGKGDYNE